MYLKSIHEYRSFEKIIEYNTNTFIEFKLNLLTYKTLSMCKPSYLICDLLHFENRQQTLISESKKLLHPGPRSGAIEVIIKYAMLCYAMLCYAMLCYAMLCYAMLCYAMLCYSVLFCAMLSEAKLS